MASPLVAFAKRQIKRLLSRASVFVTYHVRPKYARDINNWRPLSDTSAQRIGLVLQGPLWTRDDFTVETLRLYRRHCPHAIIVLSTWSDEDPAGIAAARAAGVEVVLSVRPSDAGLWNMNLQMVSACAGLARARELGAQLALKTRTDIRLYSPHYERFLEAVSHVFPLAEAGTQKRRVIGFDLGTMKHRFYGLSDLSLFGDVDDLLLYFAPGPEQPYRTGPNGERTDAELLAPETYFASRFLTRVGHAPAWSQQDSDRMFAERFCVVDQTMVDMFWAKYNVHREHKFVFYDTSAPEHAYLTFRDWLILYDRFHTPHLASRRPPVSVHADANR